MTDTLNGGDPADDNALFEQVTNPDPAPAPNPEAETEKEAPAPEAPSPAPAAEKPNSDKPADPEPSIPPARLREEAEARRRMEKENADLRARLAALEVARQPPSQPAKPEQPADPFAELITDPNAFLNKALDPVQQQIEQRLQQQKEAFSRRLAITEHGQETVQSAYQALGEAIQTNPAMKQELSRIMAAEHPFDELVQWHKRQNVLREVGNDPAAYKAKLREELMKDPEFVKQIVEQARASAQPVVSTQPAASSFPTISNIGSPAGGASPEGQSDAELFASTVRRKR